MIGYVSTLVASHEAIAFRRQVQQQKVLQSYEDNIFFLQYIVQPGQLTFRRGRGERPLTRTGKLYALLALGDDTSAYQAVALA